MIAHLVRNARPRLLAILAAPDGDLTAAEDEFADAVEKALREWPTTGVPANPEAWLFTVARSRRRDGRRGAARTRSRIDKRGEFVPLDRQDTTTWRRHGTSAEAYARAIALTTEPTARRHLEAVRATGLRYRRRRLCSGHVTVPAAAKRRTEVPMNAPGAILGRSTDVGTAHEHAGRYGSCRSHDHIVQSLRTRGPSRGRP
ncbi:sigma factor [Dietzia aurantiaca]|uniref:sigma factor n=1 Tax=Dietzia aurantiaca TaxID=983873 RepID=UPI0035583014